MSRLHYAGYEGVVEFDEEAAMFHGEIRLSRDIVTFQSRSIGSLGQAMAESLEDYLAFCHSRGETPQLPR